jgi:sugar phosphate permease
LSGVGVGLIADHFGWSGVFFTLSLLAGVTVIISFFYLFHQGRLRREAQARKTYEAP